MAFLSTYSCRAVLVNYAGVALNDGRPEDTFITISENAPRTAQRKGLSGDTSVALSPDHSVMVTLSFFPESTAAKLLNAMYYSLKDLERAGKPVLGAAPLVITDPSGVIMLVCKEAALSNKTETAFGADTGSLSFEFYVEDAQIKPLPGALAGKVAGAVSALSVKVPGL